MMLGVFDVLNFFDSQCKFEICLCFTFDLFLSFDLLLPHCLAHTLQCTPGLGLDPSLDPAAQSGSIR